MLKGEYNVLNAKVKHEQETLYTIKGKWDNRLDITVSLQSPLYLMS